MGNIYYEQKKFMNAIKHYRMALDQIPNTSKELRYKIMRNIGHAFVKLGQFHDAIDQYEMVVNEGHAETSGYPDYTSAFNVLVCYYAVGQSDKVNISLLSTLSLSLSLFLCCPFAYNAEYFFFPFLSSLSSLFLLSFFSLSLPTSKQKKMRKGFSRLLSGPQPKSYDVTEEEDGSMNEGQKMSSNGGGQKMNSGMETKEESTLDPMASPGSKLLKYVSSTKLLSFRRAARLFIETTQMKSINFFFIFFFLFFLFIFYFYFFFLFFLLIFFSSSPSSKSATGSHGHKERDSLREEVVSRQKQMKSFILTGAKLIAPYIDQTEWIAGEF